MAYHLEGFVAEKALAEKLASEISAKTVPFTDTLGIVPITDTVKATSASKASIKGFALPHTLLQAAQKRSTDGPIAYIEAHYAQGLNHQGAAVWSGETFTMEPEIDDTPWDPRESTDERPVNRALRALGVRPGEYNDEWDAAGMTRHPRTEDWI